MRFAIEFRGKNPDMKSTEVLRAAGTKWKTLAEADKQPYLKAVEAEMPAYTKAKDAYVSSGKKDAWKRDPDKPKAPMTGFLRFAQEFRKDNPALKMTEATKEAAKKWKGLSAEGRAPYEQAYKDAKATFDKSMQEYKASGKQATWEEKVGIKKLKDKAAAKKKAAADKKKAVAAKKNSGAEAKKKKLLEAKKKKPAQAKKKAAEKKKKEMKMKQKKRADLKKLLEAKKKKAAQAKKK